ncbi:MAG: 16S rRNA (uracil(1498)-N(3))-methyltransferase [Bacteroidota bacterium]
MQLFYHPELYETNKSAVFDKDESRHIIKVLRKKTGDELHITNGKGDLFLCKIIDDNPKKCGLEVLKLVEHSPSKKHYLHLLVAPTKTNDRFEWFLEKATELGIDEITPILTQNSERKKIKLERYEKVLVSAMKQSLQYTKPALNQLTPFNEVINQLQATQKFIAHCQDDHKASFYESVDQNTSVALLIGPEGDFSSDEIIKAEKNEFKTVSLGKTRLRTETAAIAACHSFALKNDFEL